MALLEDILFLFVARCVTHEFVISEFGRTEQKQGSHIYTVMNSAEISRFSVRNASVLFGCPLYKGIIDDMPSFELLKMIKKIDKTGESKFTYLSPYNTEDPWDYRDFNLNWCNVGLKTAIKNIKSGFENEE